MSKEPTIVYVPEPVKTLKEMQPLEKAQALEHIILDLHHSAERGMRQAISWNATVQKLIAGFSDELERLRAEVQMEVEHESRVEHGGDIQEGSHGKG